MFEKRRTIAFLLVVLLATPALGQELPAAEELRAQMRRSEVQIGQGLLFGGLLVTASGAFALKNVHDANSAVDSEGAWSDSEPWWLLTAGGVVLAGVGVSLLVPDKPVQQRAIVPRANAGPHGKDIGTHNRLYVTLGLLAAGGLVVALAR